MPQATPDKLDRQRSTDAAIDGPPSVSAVDFGSLGRTEPISRVFGLDRGQCIDRYYIERFLNAHAEDIRGRVLEVAENTYTRQFGGDRVTQSDVLHLTGTRQSTIVADLTRGDGLATGAFDCIILTQTLQHIYDSRAAMQTIERILAPGGTLLVSVPGISQISRYDMQRWGDYWRFTSLALRRLLEEAFAPQQVEVQAFGNVLLATAFLQGLVVEDLPHDALGFNDPDYELIVCARASMSETPS